MSLLNQMADNALQNRSKKVKEMLGSTEHNVDALDRTIDRISQTSIMFVDPARLTNLANEMRQLLEEQRKSPRRWPSQGTHPANLLPGHAPRSLPTPASVGASR